MQMEFFLFVHSFIKLILPIGYRYFQFLRVLSGLKGITDNILIFYVKGSFLFILNFLIGYTIQDYLFKFL